MRKLAVAAITGITVTTASLVAAQPAHAACSFSMTVSTKTQVTVTNRNCKAVRAVMQRFTGGQIVEYRGAKSP